MPVPEAIIFDFDGVIADTEYLHYASFSDAVSSFHLACTWEEYHEHYIGYDDRDLFKKALQNESIDVDDELIQELIRKKAALFTAKAQEAEVSPCPGAIELIRECHTRLPLGLCTGALTSDIEPLLVKFDIRHCFSAIVTADDVDVSKPAPKSYIMTMKQLMERVGHELNAAQSFAIEDTPTGVAAAKGAGLNVLAVCNTHTADKLSEAFCIVPSLKNVDWEWLCEVTP